MNEKYQQIPTEGPDREMPKSKGPNYGFFYENLNVLEF
jgi:hypothetical protein